MNPCVSAVERCNDLHKSALIIDQVLGNIWYLLLITIVVLIDVAYVAPDVPVVDFSLVMKNSSDSEMLK